MSNEKTVRPPCAACGAESCKSDFHATVCTVVSGFPDVYLCAQHWHSSSRELATLIAARRQRTVEPRFVDKHGVETRVGDRVTDGIHSGVLLHTSDPHHPQFASMLRDDRQPGDGHHGAWEIDLHDLERLEDQARIDPPADEGEPIAHIALSGADVRVPVTRITCAPHTRDSLIDSLIAALLADQNHPGTFAGYDDFEAERASREVDDALATIERHVANLQRVHRLRKGPNRHHTDSDCLGEK